MKLVAFCLVATLMLGCGPGARKKAEVDRQPGSIGAPWLNARNSCADASGIALTSSTKVPEIYHYSYKNIPICSWYGRVLNLESAGTIFSGGLEKDLKSLVVAEGVEWPESKTVVSFIASESGLTDVDLVRSTRCWYLQPHLELLPAYDVTIFANGLAVKAVANGSQVFEVGNGGFDLNRISYQAEGSDEQIDFLESNTLDGSGFLSGKNFAVFTSNGSARAFSSNGNFEFSKADIQFAQASVYANAEITLGWFEQLATDTVDAGCFPIDIKLHSIFGGGVVNNARYQPDISTVTGRPEILVGDGDGIDLANLATDPDVIAHEFAHHVIYRGVKDTNHFESVVIHEGLADYFVYAKTGNACLAETVCPAGSAICVESSCLRTGNNNLSFTDPGLSHLPHRQGQIISGMLLDLAELTESQLGGAFVKTVALSINYLLPRSNFDDLVKALMLADRDVSGGKFACEIYQKAIERGLENRIQQLVCSDFQI